MFDIGFTELMVIAIVALVVIGPEKLPKVARTVGAYIGRLQRYVNDVKADINRELELDELRKFKQTVEDTARSFESSVQAEATSAESEVNKLTQAVTEPLANLDAAPSTVAGSPAEGAVLPLEPLPVAATANAAETPPAATSFPAAVDEAGAAAKRAA